MAGVLTFGVLAGVGAHFYISRYLGVSDYMQNSHISLAFGAVAIGVGLGSYVGVSVGERLGKRFRS